MDNTWFKWAFKAHTRSICERNQFSVFYGQYGINWSQQQWNQIKPVAIFAFYSRIGFARKRNDKRVLIFLGNNSKKRQNHFFFTVHNVYKWEAHTRVHKTTIVRWFRLSWKKNRQNRNGFLYIWIILRIYIELEWKHSSLYTAAVMLLYAFAVYRRLRCILHSVQYTHTVHVLKCVLDQNKVEFRTSVFR